MAKKTKSENINHHRIEYPSPEKSYCFSAGEFSVTVEEGKENLHIQHCSGEGGYFSMEDFAEAVKEFYIKNF